MSRFRGIKIKTAQWIFILYCVMFFISFALCSASIAQENAAVREARIKTAVVYYLAKFITWPENTFQKSKRPLSVCTIGSKLILDFLEKTFDGKQVHNRSVKITRLMHEVKSPQLSSCDIVYLEEVSEQQTAGILKAITNLSILSISGQKDITDVGGMVWLFKDKNRVRIKINPKVAEKARLKVSSEILNIAEVVDDTDRE